MERPGFMQSSENDAPLQLQLQLGTFQLRIARVYKFIITVFVTLFLYTIFICLCWKQLRDKSEEKHWYRVTYSFLAIELFAIVKEVRAKIIYAGRPASYALPL